MIYPSVGQYTEAIKLAEQSPEDYFATMTTLRPVLGADGNPVMSSGNFAVVFKMQDQNDGKIFALKCFTRDQEGRNESYRLIADELKDISSPYITNIQYLEKELFVDTNTDENEFPVLLMDWVEGETLDKYIRHHIDDQYTLSMLAYQFSRLAMWLMPQPFAHGDLKPDNIIVRKNGTLTLVDYDGMYVPAMQGQKSRELGSPDFRHPMRTENDFDEHIDDFSLVSISLSIKAISLETDILSKAVNDNGLLFTQKDYLDMSKSEMIKAVYQIEGDPDFYKLLGSFLICNVNKSFSNIAFKLFDINKPNKDNINSDCGTFTDLRDGYTYKTIKIGNQIWLAENLRYLPNLHDGYYVYDYYGNSISDAKQTKNYQSFGVLYNMKAAIEACPIGWHIPSEEEWKELESYLGIHHDAKERKLFIDDTICLFHGNNDEGSLLLDKNYIAKDGDLIMKKDKDCGFDAILAGWRTYFMKFKSKDTMAKWWSRTCVKEVVDSRFYSYRRLYYLDSGIGFGTCNENCCLSVRCIQGDVKNKQNLPNHYEKKILNDDLPF